MSTYNTENIKVVNFLFNQPYESKKRKKVDETEQITKKVQIEAEVEQEAKQKTSLDIIREKLQNKNYKPLDIKLIEK